MVTNRPHNQLEDPESPDLVFDLHDGSDERVSIIIVHNDRPEYLNLCLQSIYICSMASNYEVIVVDNGSDIAGQNFLDQIEEDGIKVIRNDENLYWTKAANIGAKAADKDSKYLLFMHHDVIILNSAWIDLMVSVSESKNSGLIGLEMRKYRVDAQDINFVDEFCILVRRDCWQDVGPFVEELPQEGAGFIFSFAATHKGHDPQVIRNNCVHHYKTLALDHSEWERIIEHATASLPKYIREIQTG